MGLFGAGQSSLGFGVVYNLHDNFSHTADKISTKFKQLEGITATATAKINKAMNGMKVGFAILATSAVLLAPLALAVKTSSEFSAQMSVTGAKARASAAELDLLEKSAISLGESTKFSAKQVAEGQEFLAMAGFRSSKIIAAMPGLLDLAAAGNVNLARAADIASNTLAQFQLPAEQTGRVADVMANAIVSANTDMEQFANAMKFFGPTANAFGISLEESSAAVMLLSNAGLQGSLGTRALSTALTRLSAPTRQMQGVIDNLNLSFFDQQGNFIGLTKLIAQLSSRFENLNQKQRMAAISTLFGGEAVQELNTLLTAGVDVQNEFGETTLRAADALAYFTSENMNSAGTAQRISQQMMNNLKGDLTILKSVWETTLIKIGKAFEPVLRPLVKGIGKLISLFGKLADTWGGRMMIRLIGITGILGVAVGVVVVAINAASFAAGKAALAFATMGKTSIATAFATGGLSKGLWAVARAAWAAMIPLLPYIIVGALIAGAIYLVVRSMKEFQAVLDGTKAPASGILGLMQKVGGVIKGTMEIWRSATEEGFQLSEDTYNALQKLGIDEFVVNLGTHLVRIKSFFRGIGDSMKGTGDYAKTKFIEAFEPMKGLFKELGWDMDKATTKFENFGEAGRAIGKFLKTVFVSIIDFVTEGIKDFAKVASFVVDFSRGIFNRGDLSFKEFFTTLRNEHGNEDINLEDINSDINEPSFKTDIGQAVATNNISNNTTNTNTIKENNYVERVRDINLQIGDEAIAPSLINILGDYTNNKY